MTGKPESFLEASVRGFRISPASFSTFLVSGAFLYFFRKNSAAEFFSAVAAVSSAFVYICNYINYFKVRKSLRENGFNQSILEEELRKEHFDLHILKIAAITEGYRDEVKEFIKNNGYLAHIH